MQLFCFDENLSNFRRFGDCVRHTFFQLANQEFPPMKGFRFTLRQSVLLTLMLLLGVSSAAFSQPVNVTFRYQSQSSPAPTRVHFPGNFPADPNQWWGPNSNGVIAAGSFSQATFDSASGLWTKTFSILPGSYQYKINENGTSNGWLADPLNRVVLPPDGNSPLVVGNLTLFQVAAFPYKIANNVFVVRKAYPSLTAGIFVAPANPVTTINAFIDNTPIANAISYYNATTGIFNYVPTSPLPDGNHTFRISATNSLATQTDSVQFVVSAKVLQIQTPAFTTQKYTFTVGGIVTDTSITSVSISNTIANQIATVTNGSFFATIALTDGLNTIYFSATSAGGPVTDSVKITKFVNHTPTAVAAASAAGGSVLLSATGSTDPDAGQTATLTFKWSDDPSNPQPLIGLQGATSPTVSITKPTVAGEYYFGLIAKDVNGNADTTRSYFIVKPDGSVQIPTIQSNPSWASGGRMYFLFPRAIAPGQNLASAMTRLPYIKAMGFNIIWMMPVMKNAFTIDNNSGPGYNIIDFYNVAPEYGTNQDFKTLVDSAHAMGMKVILDVTPNHTSRSHPWASDARSNGMASPYWTWYQHTIPSPSSYAYNSNSLGWSTDGYGFVYYSGFSDQLLNFDWSDMDARTEMINVYKYWIKQFGIDGYRFDVYWGPHRRYGTAPIYGEEFMGKPVRDALKHIKPDILLLGEDDGTGPGTELIYADYTTPTLNGGLDMSYDFKLYFNSISNFYSNGQDINGLFSNIDNGGYYPGVDALYMRFMESQDEDRISYLYGSFQKTMPMASVVFTAPGLPMIWNGQEVGYGYGISGSTQFRDRSIIDWNFAGGPLLVPHYQKLAVIRSKFNAFTQHKQDTNGDGQVNSSDVPDFVRITAGPAGVLAFTRPFTDQNGLTVVNFSGTDATFPLDLTAAGALKFTGNTVPATVYLNNLYNNTRNSRPGSQLNNVSITVPAYGTAIYTVSTTADSVIFPTLVGTPVQQNASQPKTFSLMQNYPNPFNPSTQISYSIPAANFVTLKVYDILGREVQTLVNDRKQAGTYSVVFNASKLASGIYFYRLTSGDFVQTKKMILVK
jgi:cyclomaltodextrinase